MSGVNGRKTRINAALDSMAKLGPPCDDLAAVVGTILESGHLRVYKPGTPGITYSGGGFSAKILGEPGENGYMLLDAAWTDVFYDKDHFGIQRTKLNGVDKQVKVNLQTTLAHEGDHLRDRYHLDPKGSESGAIGALTQNTERCGGLVQ